MARERAAKSERAVHLAASLGDGWPL